VRSPRDAAEKARVKKTFLTILCCPRCRGPLHGRDTSVETSSLVTGSLDCPKCALSYPVIGGCPVLLEDAGRLHRTRRSFGRQWTLQAVGRFEDDTIYGKRPEEELRDFQNAFRLSDLKELSGKIILDAGCGSGRLTASLARAVPDATVVGIDISEAAGIASERCRDLPNAHVVQGNLLAPPFPLQRFDYIWSEGVIHHTPDTRVGFEVLDSLLKRDGRIYLWLYPNYKVNPFRAARTLLHKPFLLPPAVLYGLSWLLGGLLFGALRMVNLAGLVSKRYERKTLVFGFYDNLSPEFQNRHSKEEVEGWFVSKAYSDVQFLGDIAVVGKKQ
jgi:SAM-dependent methyltransferase